MARRAPTEVLMRSRVAWGLKRLWYGIQYECWFYAAPGLNPMHSRGMDGSPKVGSAGQARHDHLFDSTLARTAERLPNRMVQELFPHGRDWAEMRPGVFMGMAEMDENQELRVLEQTQQRVYAAIHAADMSLPLVECVRDAVVSGTGLLKVGVSPDTGGLLHVEAVNQSEVALERGPMGRVWGFYRKAEMPLEHIRATWPDAIRLPEERLEGEGKPKEWALVEATYYDPMDAMWYTDVLLNETPDSSDVLSMRIVERAHLVPPWIAYRYALLPGEVQGRSPVMAALPDSRTLNHAKRVRLEAASLRVAGLLLYLNDGVFNPATVRFRSGTMIPVGSNARENPSVMPLELPGDVQLSEIVIADTIESLKETMLDFALPDPTGAVRSATEIAERQAEARQQRGMPYLRLMQEVGRPLLRACVYLLSEGGHLPELADVQGTLDDGRPRPMRMDGTDVQLHFVSPLVQAQQLSDAQTLAMWARMSQESAGPEAWMSGAKVEDLPEALGKKLRVDPGLWRSEEEREERMLQQMEAMAQQGQAQAPPTGEMA